MSTNRQIAISLALLASTLIALLLIALAQITTSITWYVLSIFIANLVVVFVSINFVIKKNQQNQRQLLLNALKLDISTNQSLQDILCNQASKTSIAGKNIDDKASELAINSAEVSFFLEKLSSAIELSSEDVDRLASAAE
jgi:methyl-accepting chemotaxis protein